MNIHILGTGAIGCFIGAVLKTHKSKVTLLLRSPAHVTDFANRNNTITYRRQDKAYQVEGYKSALIGDPEDMSPITSLVVATKAHHTLKALSPVASRLSSNSTILLLQNGMGVAEELVENFWPNGKSPNILVGVNRHAVERLDPYDVCHYSGFDDPDALNIGQLPLPGQPSKPNSDLIDTMLSIPEFNTKSLSWSEMRVKMLKKLIVNACINPVASVLMERNKSVLTNGGTALMTLICEEAFSVLKDDLPGETVDSLMEMVLEIAKDAGENKCSTLQDIHGLRLTEIDYLNGYLCKLGKQKGINTTANQALVDLIHAKEDLYQT
ncbi:2-dehydropantoate 2-reductase [Helicostylum pulchrum]|uniref:2-dehydropantoate 2-reductase n=1 Tax=Helicostylum pulchrum TaxID=562976 RepID=A0ABP9Y7A6_9FUNG|nr:2-dehydropantoate 2-reductase [Helicostylum pulchrum]